MFTVSGEVSAHPTDEAGPKHGAAQSFLIATPVSATSEGTRVNESEISATPGVVFEVVEDDPPVAESVPRVSDGRTTTNATAIDASKHGNITQNTYMQHDIIHDTRMQHNNHTTHTYHDSHTQRTSHIHNPDSSYTRIPDSPDTCIPNSLDTPTLATVPTKATPMLPIGCPGRRGAWGRGRARGGLPGNTSHPLSGVDLTPRGGDG